MKLNKAQNDFLLEIKDILTNDKVDMANEGWGEFITKESDRISKEYIGVDALEIDCVLVDVLLLIHTIKFKKNEKANN